MTLSDLLTIKSALRFALSRGWPEGRQDEYEKAIEVENLIAQLIAAEDTRATTKREVMARFDALMSGFVADLKTDNERK